MPNDFLLDEDGDLLVQNGDFVVGESTTQHQHLLLTTSAGEWKMSPKAGVNINSFLEDDGDIDLATEIREQFEADGMKVNTIQSINDKMYIDASYEG